MNKLWELELKVGLFVGIGVIMMMVGILLLGGTDNMFSKTVRYESHFKSVEGLISGAKVVVGGIQVGTVKSVDFDLERRDVRIEMKIQKKYTEYIRKDSKVEISTQGVLGDKFLTIAAGTPSSPILEEGSEIETQPVKDIAQFLSQGDKFMVTINSLASNLDQLVKSFNGNNRGEIFFQSMSQTSKNLADASQKLSHEMKDIEIKAAVRNLNQILGKINAGTGSLGAFVNDPSLYYDVKSLMGGANRNRIVRNLIRKTVQDNDAATSEDKK